MNKYEEIISLSLRELIDLLSIEGDLEMLSIDFHPWNGLLEYSILTQVEADEDPLLKDSEEMAAWKLFHVSNRSDIWKEQSSEIAYVLKISYEKTENKKEMLESEYKEIVSAMQSKAVISSLSELNLSETFQISVANLDSGDEYYYY